MAKLIILLAIMTVVIASKHENKNSRASVISERKAVDYHNVPHQHSHGELSHNHVNGHHKKDQHKLQDPHHHDNHHNNKDAHQHKMENNHHYEESNHKKQVVKSPLKPAHTKDENGFHEEGHHEEVKHKKSKTDKTYVKSHHIKTKGNPNKLHPQKDINHKKYAMKSHHKVTHAKNRDIEISKNKEPNVETQHKSGSKKVKSFSHEKHHRAELKNKKHDVNGKKNKKVPYQDTETNQVEEDVKAHQKVNHMQNKGIPHENHHQELKHAKHDNEIHPKFKSKKQKYSIHNNDHNSHHNVNHLH